MSALPSLLSARHMVMNAGLLVPGNYVFYLRGTTGERVPAAVVGLSSLLQCVGINHKHSRHMQYHILESPMFPRTALSTL